MDVINGKKITIKIPVLENDNYSELSDDDIISYSLYDLNGNVIENIEDKKIEVTDLDSKSFIDITIPQEANVIGEGKDFDSRVLIVNYTLRNSNRVERKNYRLIPFTPYVCGPNDVRTVLGVPSTVIEDDMVDIYAAYLKCKSLMEVPENLDVYLSSGTNKEHVANRVITLCSALTFRTSLPMLTPKIESDGVVSQTRFTTTIDDFEKLFDDIESELENLLADLEDVDIQDLFSPNMFVIGELTDTFTGS